MSENLKTMVLIQKEIRASILLRNLKDKLCYECLMRKSFCNIVYKLEVKRISDSFFNEKSKLIYETCNNCKINLDKNLHQELVNKINKKE